MEAGRVVRELLNGASSSLSAFSSVRSDRQVTRAVQAEEPSRFRSWIFFSFSARIALRLSLSLGCLLQA